MDKLKMHSTDLTQDNIARIRELFPGCVTEAKNEEGNVKLAVDFDQLRQELSDSIVEGPQERYHLNWPGKLEALLTANAPIAKTLRPCREESIDFDTTKNLFIEGDNLDALKLFQETYLGKVKMIYIDPPYNTGGDFVYVDRFYKDSRSYLEESNQVDEEGNRLVANPESNGRFHSTWLNMIYPRLKLARNILSDDGVIFISIDDNEFDNAKKICCEIFGGQNFLGVFVVRATPNARNYGHIAKMHEYCLMFAKDSSLTVTFEELVEGKEFKFTDEIGGFNIHPLYNSDESFHKDNRPNLYYPFYVSPNSCDLDGFLKISLTKQSDLDVEVYPPKSSKNGVQFVWRWGKEKASQNLNKEIVAYRTEQGEYRVVRKLRHTSQIVRSMLLDKEYSGRRGTAEVEELFNAKVFSFPKPISLITKFIEVATSSDDLIVDFFAGSATTAHAVLQQNLKDGGNRRFICVQMPEEIGGSVATAHENLKTIADISKTRMKLAGNQIKMANRDDEWGGDIGFRVLKVDSSNMADIYYEPDALDKTKLGLFVDNIKPDRTPEDLLFQVMLDWGIDLALPISRQVIQGKELFFVDGNALVACFDAHSGIDEGLVKELTNHQPLRVVFRDSGFKDSAVKINVEQIFKSLSPSTEVKCI